jgi:YfiH family protein
MSSGRAGVFGCETLPCGWLVGRFAALDRLPGVRHAVTTRRGLDVREAAADRPAAARQVARAVGLDAAALCEQVHGADVLRVAAGGGGGQADALVTDRLGLGLAGFSADCPLILVADTEGPAVGIAHASWRGTVQRIARRLVEALAGDFGAEPSNLVACISPSAGPCCYEVGADVVAAAADGLGDDSERFFPRRAGRRCFDLWSANRQELLAAGLRAENVHVAGVCTICRNELFPSYRAEGAAAGRFVALIGRAARAAG